MPTNYKVCQEFIGCRSIEPDLASAIMFAWVLNSRTPSYPAFVLTALSGPELHPNDIKELKILAQDGLCIFEFCGNYLRNQMIMELSA